MAFFVLCVLLMVVFATPTFATNSVEQITGTIEIGPGKHYAIYYDMKTGELKVIELPGVRLPAVAHKAIAEAPIWIREKLKKAFEDLTKRDIRVHSHSKPVLGDLNGDGLLDLVVGSADGSLTYYENTGVVGFPQWTRNDKLFAGVGVCNYSAPSLVDLNGDKKLDLAVGCGDGKIYFWWNVGKKEEPEWEMDETVFADIDVGSYSVPTFADLNADGLMDLIVGSEVGLSCYRNVGSSKKPAWTRDDTLLEGVPVLPYSAPAFADLAGDGKLYLIIGAEVVKYDNWWGGKADLADNTLRRTVDLSQYTTATLTFRTRYEIEEGWDFGFVQVSTDGGKTWTSLSDVEGRTTYEHASGAKEEIVANLPGFTGSSNGWVNETFDLSPYAGKTIMLQFRYMTDWGFTLEGWFIDDIQIVADGKTIFYDDASTLDPGWSVNGWTRTTVPVPKLYVFKNVGTIAHPVWERQEEMLADVNVGKFSAPTLGDIDNDGRIDLLIGCLDGYVYSMVNYGTPFIPEYPLWKSGAEETLISTILWGPGYYPDVDRLVAVNEPKTMKYVEIYANLLLEADYRYKDEIAYCIANEQTAHLKIFADKGEEDIYELNVRAIYEMAPKLKYVKLVEHDIPRLHRYTTLAFHTEDGDWVEVPKEVYYQRLVMLNRYIVLPWAWPDLYEGNWYMTYLPWDTTYNVTLYDRVKDAETVTEAMWNVALWIKVDIGAWWRTGPKPSGWYNIYKNLLNPAAGIWCGEFSIITMAAGRAVMIPVANTVNLGEDHQWDEFFNEELRWVHIDTSATAPGDVEGLREYFDNPTVYEVKWGKDISAVMWWEQGGRYDHVISRTEKTGYTPTSLVKFKVVDKNGRPIDGARVEAWAHWIERYYGIPLISFLNYTNLNGEASMHLGYNKYTFVAITRIGHAVIKKTIEEGRTYEIVFKIDKELPKSFGEASRETREVKPLYKIDFKFKVLKGYQANPHWIHVLWRIFSWQDYYYYEQGINLDAYILDEQDYKNFASGLDFNAYGMKTWASSGELEDIPMDTDAYIILSNERSLTTTLVVEYEVSIEH